MDQRNMLMAFVLSVLVLVGWSVLFPQPESTNVAPIVKNNASIQVPVDSKARVAELRPTDVDVAPLEQRPLQATVQNMHYVTSDLIRVGMDDRGYLTETELLKYTESLEPDAKNVRVLDITEAHQMYITSGVTGQSQATPFVQISSNSNQQTQVAVFESTLTNGMKWQRTLTLTSGSYKVHIEDRIQGGGGLKMFRQVVEKNPDRNADTFYEHMGSISLLGNELKENTYDDLDEHPIQIPAMGGWTGMMNRYFIAAIIGDEGKNYRYYYKGDGFSYQSGVFDDGILEKGDAVFSTDIYIGPKSIPTMETLGVGLERSVDFGWFAFIAKPMHNFMLWLFQYVNNFGWCIILLVVVIKIFFFYPTHKAYQSMGGMRKIQPEMMRLKELHGDDKQKMGQEVMKLYKKNKVNPLGGCLPILIQIPVFFALYKVLLMSIEMRQAPFIGWLHDLSVQDPYFILPVLMGASMFIQQKLNPQPADAMQAKIMQFLPPVFTIMFLFFPSGLVLYWVVNNTLAIAQQWFVMKRMNAL